MSLRRQFFFTLLMVSALLIALLFMINSWTFSRGLTHYVNQVRLAPLVERLAEGYGQHNGWQWLGVELDAEQPDPTDKKRLVEWHRLIADVIAPPPPKRPRPDNASAGTAPPAQGTPGRGAAKPQHERKKTPRDGKGRDPARRLQRIAADFMVVDAARNTVVGQLVARDTRWLPISLEGKVVGYLGYRKDRRLNGLLHEAFEKQLKSTFAQIALVVVALSALLSLPLASRLIRPIDAMNETVGKIRDGDYDARVEQQRGDELGELGSSINTMAASLKQNQAARRRWIAEISHELRTPISVLRGELEALQDGVRATDQRALESLQDQTTRLTRLVDDLHTLSLSDLGALDYRFQCDDLAEIVADFCAAANNRVVSAGFDLQIETLHAASVRVDRQRINQMLSNLLGNSLAYTHSGGIIRVSVVIDSDDTSGVPASITELAPSVTLRWEDSEPGVDEQQLGKLFEPLYRAESSRSRRTGGAGLGLSIVERIVTAHEGRVVAEQSGLGGLAVLIQLPLEKNQTG